MYSSWYKRTERQKLYPCLDTLSGLLPSSMFCTKKERILSFSTGSIFKPNFLVCTWQLWVHKWKRSCAEKLFQLWCFPKLLFVQPEKLVEFLEKTYSMIFSLYLSLKKRLLTTNVLVCHSYVFVEKLVLCYRYLPGSKLLSSTAFSHSRKLNVTRYVKFKAIFLVVATFVPSDSVILVDFVLWISLFLSSKKNLNAFCCLELLAGIAC